MALEVKICGLMQATAVDRAQAGGADYLGFIFYPPSPRALDPAQARDLVLRIEPPVRACGLFVDPTDSEIEAVLAHVPLDILQLHGQETPERVAAIATRSGLKVMKALRIETEDDLAPLRDYEAVADMILFDAKPPRDAGWPGGHGLPFDWRLLEGLRMSRPWALAGGLRVENLRAAVELLAPPIVDVSSGVESAPGTKDPEKLDAFLALAARLRDEVPAR